MSNFTASPFISEFLQADNQEEALEILNIPSGPPIPTTVSLDGAVVDSVEGNIPAYWQADNQAIDSIQFGNKVEAIGTRAFYECDGLTGLINIPEGVKLISAFAFRDCDGITAVNLPDTLEYVGTEAFYDCDNIAQLTIPANVHTIEDEGFDSMENLTSVVFLGKDIDLVYQAFGDNPNLNSVILPSELKVIGPYAFGWSYSLPSIDLPETLTLIDYSAFLRSGLESIVIPNSVTRVLAQAFAYCENLSSVVLSSNLTEIEYGVFTDCFNLGTIDIPDNVKQINSAAFYNCTALSSINFSANLELLDGQAFVACTSLPDLAFNSSLGFVGNGCFSGCTFEVLSFSGGVWLGSGSIGSMSNLTTVNFGVSGEGSTEYQAESGVLNGIASIENKPGMSGGQSVGNLGNGIDNWFELRNVTVPTAGIYRITVYYASNSEDRALSLQVIDPYFYTQGQTKPTPSTGSWDEATGEVYYDFFLRAGANTIRFFNEGGEGSYAPPVDRISVDNTKLTVIEPFTFYNCSALNNVILPSNVSRVDTGAFYECSSLERVYVECDASVFNPDAFNNTAITKIFYKAGTQGWNENGDNLWNGIDTELWTSWPSLMPPDPVSDYDVTLAADEATISLGNFPEAGDYIVTFDNFESTTYAGSTTFGLYRNESIAPNGLFSNVSLLSMAGSMFTSASVSIDTYGDVTFDVPESSTYWADDGLVEFAVTVDSNFEWEGMRYVGAFDSGMTVNMRVRIRPVA